MQFVADLHLHSKYSRAVSPRMTLPVMADYARKKGLDILTASDFTHPLWFKEISSQLEESAEGLYKIKDQISPPKADQPWAENDQKNIKFLLSTEISSIYKQGDKLRRIHNLVFAPNLSVVEKINEALINKGCNLSADGRPIIGLSSKSLLELILGIDEDCFLIPCHVWTPHFGIYGSASGFDSLSDAFGDYSKYIYGVETGLSSDPDMNWSLNELRHRSILSFSDAHSPEKMGREATVFELESLTYKNIKEAIMKPSQLSEFSSQQSVKNDTSLKNIQNRPLKTENRILYTIEFYPEEGKYHFSGHRNCKVSYDPSEIEMKGTICPVCHKRLTEGVFLRVLQLAGSSLNNRVQIKHNKVGLKWYTDMHKLQPPYVKLVPLLEIVAESMHATVASQKVKDMFFKLCDVFGSELDVLLKVSMKEIERIGGERIAEGVLRVREGNIVIIPGFDGEYGMVSIWKNGEEIIRKKETESQLTLEF